MRTGLWSFAGATRGPFTITRIVAIKGETLPSAPRLSVTEGLPGPSDAVFSLVGVVSNERYTTRAEKNELVERQESIGREEARLGALIPIRKSPAWWCMTQDERRSVLEERSKHIAIGMKALPYVARRLHHCRDLDREQPFDFLTWFDFRPEHESVFDDLLGCLRETEEWAYVEREVEIRVSRPPAT